MNYANFGTVSSGTMRNEDLLPDLASELEYHLINNADEWCSDSGRAQRKTFLDLVHEAREIDPDDENASEVVCELFDALQTFAPPYAYFGAHPGDGADYGFWLSEEIEESFDGLKVDDTSEVPDDYSGEVLHINDHGNMTLYVADNGKLSEVWAIA